MPPDSRVSACRAMPLDLAQVSASGDAEDYSQSASFLHNDCENDLHPSPTRNHVLSDKVVARASLTSAGKRVARNPEIFRGALAREVLAWCAAVFAENEVGGAAAKEAGDMEVPGVIKSISDGLISDVDASRDEKHIDSDRMFFGTAQATEIDVFISHVWNASRTLKYLALCYFVNMRLAVSCSVAVSCSILVYIVSVYGPYSMGGQMDFLMLWLVYVPIAVFYIMFFFGHTLPLSRGGLMVWLDKMCIHQTRLALKSEGISAVPQFVAKSKQMCVLWNKTYFERLWCCAELATSIVTWGSEEQVIFQPLWLAPWVLITIFLDNFAVGLWQSYVIARIGPGTAWSVSIGNTLAGEGTALSVFLMEVIGVGVSMGTSYLILAIPNLISFDIKMDNHAQMIDMISGFNLASAKCTEESDREIIEESIEELFATSPELGQDPRKAGEQTAIQRFEYFVQNAVRGAVERRVGRSGSMPWSRAAVVFMPLLFTSFVNVLGCDGQPCVDSYQAQGYNSVKDYFVVQILSWGLPLVLIFPTTYPVMLQGMSFASRLQLSKCASTLVNMIVVCLSYYFMAIMSALWCACVINAWLDGSPEYWIGSGSCALLLGLLNWQLFR